MVLQIRSTVLGLLLAGIGVCGAHADSITQVTTASALVSNDQVSWSQFSDGTNLGGYFTAFSDGGYQLDGAFANAESANVFRSQGQINGQTFDSSAGYFNYGGPVTFTVGGASAIGATISNSAASRNKMTFSASLTLFNGATQIGSVSGSADDNGDPIFLGAIDTSGQNITAFTYAVTSLGGPRYLSAPTVYGLVYDANAGFQDAAFCASLHKSDFSGTSLQALNNDVKCPQTASYAGVDINKIRLSPDHFAAIKNDLNLGSIVTMTATWSVG